MQNIQRPTSYTKSRTKTFDLVITAILAKTCFRCYNVYQS